MAADDEEMTDMSQLATQSGSIAFSSFSLSNSESDREPIREPWGQIVIYKIVRFRYGVRRPAQYNMQKLRTYGEFG